MIDTYQAFVERVEELGMMTFTRNPWEIPALEDEARGGVWADVLPDPPWQWKNRIAQDGRALYGHVLGSKLMFISLEMLPAFFAALRPQDDIFERYERGEVDHMTMRVAREMRSTPRTTGYQLRQMLGVTGKEKGKVEGALRRLERELQVSIGASTHKVSKSGEPYGWGINELWLCEAFYGPQIEASRAIGREEGRERIIRRMRELGADPEAQPLFAK